jgi:hypothetical protein
MIINPTFQSSITSDSNAAVIENTINTAILFYESSFLDPITVNIAFGEGGGLGQTSTSFATITYASFLAALTADATTANDATALSHLPAGPGNPVDGQTLMDITTANARAIGINANPPSGQPDGTILLNTSITNPGSPGSSLSYYLLPVVEHEIDEVLGFNSGLNTTSPIIYPGDLFRYSSTGVRTYSTSSSALAYFSIDGGATLLDQFNNTGSGDYNDWQSNPLPIGVPPEVQDASATPGADPSLGVELTELDVIGYDLQQNPTPEPGTWVLLLSGLVAGGFARRRLAGRKA